MSVKIMSQVWELDLKDALKFVLLAFADFADDDGYCRPSPAYVAWKTGYSERQIQRFGKQLRARNLLLPAGTYETTKQQMLIGQQPQRGRGRIVIYRVVPENGVRLTAYRKPPERVTGVSPFSKVKGDKTSTERVTKRAVKGDKTGQNSICIPIDTSVDPSVGTSEGAVAPLLPEIVPIGLWLAFVEMRKKIRKPLTDHAGELIRRQLKKLQDEGEDPIAVMEQSIRNGWQDVYEVRKERNDGIRTKADDRQARSRAALTRVFGGDESELGAIQRGLPAGTDATRSDRLPRRTP